MISRAELLSLYNLLDDTQEIVVRELEKKFLSLGEEIVPELYAVDFERNRVNHERARAVVDLIRRSRALERLERILNVPYPDINLEEAAFAVARFGFPAVEMAPYSARLDDMATDIRRTAGREASHAQTLLTMRRHLFGELGFSGNRESYYDPENSYVNRVLDSRRGIPISLSVILLLLGQRLGLPLQGIGMPMHFLVRFKDDTQEIYVDAYNNGVLVSENHCRDMLERSGYPFTQEMLAPVTNRYTLERMLRNLLYAHQQTPDPAESENVTALLLRVNPDYAGETEQSEDDEDGEEEE